ncbi:unnamed protein product [Arctia plantaginis]|uniref:Uncharacterized protein n=1 Tax=Arctia plantaginis TaxID=874455 RepID=A0A8S0ZC01_ARCPL|nr:unnamed protein product [Arctia plantaginis]
MVRTYKPKTDRRSTDEERIKNAISEVTLRVFNEKHLRKEEKMEEKICSALKPLSDSDSSVNELLKLSDENDDKESDEENRKEFDVLIRKI